MSGSLGRDVIKCHHPIVFVDDIGGNFFPDNLAENGVAHGGATFATAITVVGSPRGGEQQYWASL